MRSEYNTELEQYNDDLATFFDDEEDKDTVITQYNRCNQLYSNLQTQRSSNQSTFNLICDNFCV